MARNVARWTRIAAFGNVPLDAQDAADWVKAVEKRTTTNDERLVQEESTVGSL